MEIKQWSKIKLAIGTEKPSKMSFFRYGADEDDLDDAEEKLSRFCRFENFPEDEKAQGAVAEPAPVVKSEVQKNVKENISTNILKNHDSGMLSLSSKDSSKMLVLGFCN